MFTGIIQQVGTLARREARGQGQRLTIRHAVWATPLVPGESVAVNGACLTVAAAGTGEFSADVLRETLDKTCLGGKGPGAALNLERALRLDDRLGGHMVQGHVDGTGTVAGIKPSGSDRVLEIACGRELVEGMVAKGSVAIDGVSLTIVALAALSFSVHLIPHTWAHTALRTLAAGELVNLETDVIGKYVKRYVLALKPAGSVTEASLRRAGFGG